MLHEEVKKYRELSGDTNPNTPISRIGGYLDGYEKALEQEPVKDIKEYYKDIWDCDINHPRYEDTVAEIVETSYRSGYVHGVENTAKEFRFELEQKTKTGRWITINNSFF